MNVILTVNGSPWTARVCGGSQRSTHALACELANLGAQITAVYCRAPLERIDVPAGLPYRVVWATVLRYPFTDQPPVRPLNVLATYAMIRRLTAAPGPWIVHGAGEEAALVPHLRRYLPLACVMTPRYSNYPEPLLRRGGPTWFERPMLWIASAKYMLLGSALRGADLVCPASSSAARMVGSAYGLDPSRIEVVPNGVDAVFLDVERAPDAHLGPLVFFGRLHRSKGADLFLETIASLGPQAPRALVIGHGGEESSLRSLAHRLGISSRVEFLPWRPRVELARILAGASLAILPSREESFGNAVVEAMAAATPTVSTRAGSLPEVAQDGLTALLVPPDDVSALRQAVTSLLAAPERARELGEQGRRIVLDRYSWRRSAQTLLRHYERLASGLQGRTSLTHRDIATGDGMMGARRAIDIVYTWVDGAREDFQRTVRKYSQRASDLNPERTRDLHCTLKYSLRSVQKYAPWLNNVVLFTCRPQVPDWLDTGHPRVRIVHHDEVIDPEYLPTFNTRTIESYLHRVPTASDTFLYFNDDWLFGSATGFEDFMKDGRIRIMGTLFGERIRSLIFARWFGTFPNGFVEHTPLLIKKPYWEAMLSWFPEEVRRTRSERFRRLGNLRMQRLYRYYHLGRPEIPTEVVPFWRLLRYHRFHMITNNYERQRRKLKALREFAPKFYCLNDDQRAVPDPRVVQLVHEFLEDYYPEKSEFER